MSASRKRPAMTEARLAANRRNAGKSTGPRTDACLVLSSVDAASM